MQNTEYLLSKNWISIRNICWKVNKYLLTEQLFEIIYLFLKII